VTTRGRVLSARFAGNAQARAAILQRVQSALGRGEAAARARSAADDLIAAHRHGPRPAMPADLVAHFLRRATDMASTVDRVDTTEAIPGAVARYLDRVAPPPGEPLPRAGVCWPEFAGLDWLGAGLAIDARPATGNDRLAITGAFCAIAETGTLVVTSGAATPTASTLLPETHVAVVRADRIVAGMEEAFALVRAECHRWPRAVNLISGPSRTGDIEQTIVLGAHGPFRVHLLVIG